VVGGENFRMWQKDLVSNAKARDLPEVRTFCYSMTPKPGCSFAEKDTLFLGGLLGLLWFQILVRWEPQEKLGYIGDGSENEPSISLLDSY